MIWSFIRTIVSYVYFNNFECLFSPKNTPPVVDPKKTSFSLSESLSLFKMYKNREGAEGHKYNYI